MELTILHTADLHSRLDAERAEALKFLREKVGALLLDSGDAVAAGNIYVRPTEPVLERMNLAGYHAMAVGNREYFFRRSGMLRKTRAADFTVLCANLVHVGGDMGHILPWTTLETTAGTIGLFGLAPTMIRPGSFWERFSDMRFIDWREAAEEACEALRDEVDWLIALSHRGLDDDLALAAEHPELDIVLGGHSHASGDHLVGPGPTLVSHAGHHARTAALIRAERGQAGGNRFNSQVMEMA